MLLFCFGNVTLPDKDVYVDMLECNHVHNKNGEYVFTQVILWAEFPSEGIKKEYRAVDWIMINEKEKNSPPIKKGKLWTTQKKCYYKGKEYAVNVHAPIYKESWTMDDPERVSNSKHYGGDKQHLKPELFKPWFDPEVKAARESINETKDE
jgi:hypothetical protein